MAPGIASLFVARPRPERAIADRRHIRRTRLPRLLLGAILAAYMLGVLATALVISVPMAIDLKLFFSPPI